MSVEHGKSMVKYLWPLFLGFGLLLRVLVYWQNRSLFLDEANLAHNIAEHTLAGLFAPLDYQQYAPPLFLVLEKINWWIAGPSEWSLRFWPLCMGCLALYLMYRLLRETVGSTLPVLFTFYLLVFSQVFIRYSSEVKQYSTDMAVTAGLIWLAVQHPPVDRKSMLYWALAGSLALWLSMPSVFVLAGAGLCFLYQHMRRERSGIPFFLLVPGALWIIQFGIYYWLILQADMQKTALIDYHRSYFWPLWPNTGEEWTRLWDLIQSLSGTLIGHTVPVIFLGVVGLAAGFLELRRQCPDRLLLFGVPVVLSILASGLGHYSLMERLTLFMMPPLYLILAAGLLRLWNRSGKWGMPVLAALFLLVLPLRKGWSYIVAPLKYEEMRPLLQTLSPLLEQQDVIWVDHHAKPAFNWYTQQYPSAGLSSFQAYQLVYSDWDGQAVADLSPYSGKSGRRVWLIFSHLVSAYNLREMEQDLKLMREQFGEPLREVEFPGVMVWGYDIQ